MPSTRHFIMDDKVQLYMRPRSPMWWSACSIDGKQVRVSTKEESLSRAKDVARDWYLGLLGKYRSGELKQGTRFKSAAAQFLSEYEVITQGERHPMYVAQFETIVRLHLNPFFGDKVVTEITPGMVQQYRAHRMTSRLDKKTGLPKKPSRSTLHHETIALRHVLKTAQRHGWLPYVPNISPPYKSSGKIGHRAWFSPDEYRQLYEATRDRAQNPRKASYKFVGHDLHDYVLFMVNSGLRPDEGKRLQVRDVEIVKDGPDEETILHLSVRGKRGVGYCKTMPGAVYPFRRMVERHGLKPNDLLFPTLQRELFNTILKELDLKKDREGNPRTFYSLRHTYICLRLLEGADIYQLAKNCRTSVEMIEKHYAVHLKNMLDARAINVRRVNPPKGRADDSGEGASI